jgi:hypothetical protein
MRKIRGRISLRIVKSPEPAAILPLAYAAEIVFELSQLRHECSDIAVGLISSEHVDEQSLEECAQLDDAVAEAQRVLYKALQAIRHSRNARFGTAGL